MSIELLLWLLLAFFIGCIIGYLLRWLFAPEADAVTTTDAVAAPSSAATTAGRTMVPPRAAQPETKAKPTISVTPAKVINPAPAKPMPVAASVPAAKPKPAIKTTVTKPAAAKATAKPKKARATGKPKRPRGLAAARGGKPDNLQLISGVGPKLEKTLQGLGFFHFSQIAGWSSDEVLWVDEHLRFKGRIAWDKWIAQAKKLAAGKSGSRATRGGKKSG